MFSALLFCVSCDNGKISSPASQEIAQSDSSDISTGMKPVDHEVDKTSNENKDSVNVSGFRPFNIYTDRGNRSNHYVPSGFMGDWKCLQFDDNWKQSCLEGDSCIKIDYDVVCSRNNQKWAGIYWLNPPNNWGNRKGGFNLIGAKKLVFWAKGQEGGEQIQEFKVGGIGNNYPDTDMATTGPVILSTVWQKYSIDLEGKDLFYISGGFAWTTSADVNGDTCIFYLDNIHFE